MKSTTGAYGDFPSYYYGKGNLFGSYLLGRTAGTSWDTQKEMEGMGDVGPAIHLRTKVFTATPVWRTDLGRYVNQHFSAEFASLILQALRSSHERAGEAKNADQSVFRTLDEFAATVLGSAEREMVRTRLEQVVEEARRRARQRKQAPRQVRRPSRPKSRVTAKPRPAARETKSPATPVAPVRDTSCAICAAPLSPEERARCGRKSAIFFGRGYCNEHAAKLENIFDHAGD